MTAVTEKVAGSESVNRPGSVAVNVINNLKFSLTVQNIFDNEHIEFVGAPKIGRLAIGRLTQSF